MTLPCQRFFQAGRSLGQAPNALENQPAITLAGEVGCPGDDEVRVSSVSIG
jgi:hypothetical protein